MQADFWTQEHMSLSWGAAGDEVWSLRSTVPKTGGFLSFVEEVLRLRVLRCCLGALQDQRRRGERRGAPLRPRRPGRVDLRARRSVVRGEEGIQRRQRPVQGGARVCQLPGEPGALRGRGLRAVGGHR